MKPRQSMTTLALAAALLTFATAASAQATAPAAMTDKAGAVNSADRQFAMAAAKGGMAEVALGQLAQQKGGSDSVKQFGAHMVEDHTKANDELKQIATAKGLTLPDAPPRDAKAQKLESMSGAGFDKAYMAKMMADHKKTVALFKKEASSGSDPELKAFAAKTLPTVQSHLAMVHSDMHAAGGAMKQ